VKCYFTRKSAVLCFCDPLRAMYEDHLRLIGKRVVNFLLVLSELFSLGVMAEELMANIGWKSAISLQWGPVDPKFQVEGVAPTNHCSSQKTRLNDLTYDIKIWTDLSSILTQITRLTDEQTEFTWLDRICIPCSMVKSCYNYRHQLFRYWKTNNACCTVCRITQEKHTSLLIALQWATGNDRCH